MYQYIDDFYKSYEVNHRNLIVQVEARRYKYAKWTQVVNEHNWLKLDLYDQSPFLWYRVEWNIGKHSAKMARL